MKILFFGGSGHVGAALRRYFTGKGHTIRIVTRTPKGGDEIGWDAVNLGSWTEALDESDVVINLAGRRVHCRYNVENLNEMMDSRINSTKVVGEAIAALKNPPRVWLQASTATIYAHRFDASNDESMGILGGSEPDVPRSWDFSIQIAKSWEKALFDAPTPSTRKIAMRSAITMSVDKESAFDVFSKLTRLGLGGALGNGRQFVSWIHETDFARSVEFLIDRSDLEGPINLCAPNPLPQAEFAKELRKAWGTPFGLPATSWMVNLGTWAMDADSELVMKSRRVVPQRLIKAGFEFSYPHWAQAAQELVSRMRSGQHG